MNAVASRTRPSLSSGIVVLGRVESACSQASAAAAVPFAVVVAAVAFAAAVVVAPIAFVAAVSAALISVVVALIAFVAAVVVVLIASAGGVAFAAAEAAAPFVAAVGAPSASAQNLHLQEEEAGIGSLLASETLIL